MRLLPKALRARSDVYGDVADLSRPEFSYYVMVAVSAVIAAFGLLANSTAVVIGAMLVAPLMGPIFGIALGLLLGERRLLWKALLTELAGVLLAVAIGVLVGLMPLRMDFGVELLARTQPTLYDLLVAVAAGFAGAYALMDERVSPALPGVAIAVAIIPPLASCGLCLAAGEMERAGGAALLFVANFLAIELAAAAVFALLGMLKREEASQTRSLAFVRRFGLSLLALMLVAVFMTNTLIGLIAERQLATKLEVQLGQQVATVAGARVDSVFFSHQPDGLAVVATVLTPAEFAPSEVKSLEAELRKTLQPDLNLVVRSVLSKDYNAEGPVFLAEGELTRREQALQRASMLEQASQVLTNHLQSSAAAQLAELRLEQGQGAGLLVATVRTAEAVQPWQVAEAEAAVRIETGKQVSLMVRSVLTRDADASGFLHEQTLEQPAPPSEAEKALQARLQEAISRQLARRVEGTALLEVSSESKAGRLEVIALVQTPHLITPEVVAEVQTILRKYVTPQVDLTVQSRLGADATAQGYVIGTEARPN